MRYIPVFALFLLSQLAAWAQSTGFYGNEWYAADTGRTFIKLQLSTDGLYRLHSGALLAAGYDLSAVNPAELKMIYRGNEVPIYVAQTPGGTLDFLEFWGQQNDGRVDALMYRDPFSGLYTPDLQPNIDISLFTDTAAYFLTWSAGPGLRYQAFFESDYGLYNPEPSFPFTAQRIFRPGDSLTSYVLGGGGPFDAHYQLNSDYGPGEGYMGPEFAYMQPYSLPLATPDALNGSMDSIRFEMRLFGQSHTQHQQRVFANGVQILDTQLPNAVQVSTYAAAATLPLLSGTTLLDFQAHYPNQDINRIGYAKIRYPRLPHLHGDSSVQISGWSSNVPAYFQFQQATGDDTVFVYDLENGTRTQGIIQNDTAHVIIPGAAGSRNLLLATDRAILEPIIGQAGLANLSDTTQGAAYVIITHRELAASAQAYATYRDTNQVNGFSTKVVFTDEIYDEFGYGSLTPWAIKRFLNYALEHWATPPRYVLMWGQARYQTREYSNVMVPTFGHPNTDFEFVSPLSPDSLDLQPQIAIGRVNVQHDVEGDAYLAKIQAYEYAPWQDWMRRSLFLSMPSNEDEHQIFSLIFDDMRDELDSAYLPWLTRRFPDLFPATLPIDLTAFHANVDTGTAILHLLGYRYQPTGDVFIKEPFEYTNWGKQPFLIGQLGYGEDLSTQGFGSRWLLEPGRGCIGYFGNSAAIYLIPIADYNRTFYDILREDTLGRGIGEIIRQAGIAYTDQYTSQLSRTLPRQLNLQGDPALRLHLATFSFSDVWPGDANDDDVADMMDLLPIGLAFADTGSTRPDASLQWTAQPAPDWPNMFLDSVNYKHADTNGDSLINAADTLAIHLNYGLTHNKTEDNNFTNSGVPMSLIYPASGNTGDTVQIQVMLGDSLTPADSVYGVAFRMSYDLNLVADSSVAVSFADSWMGNAAVNALSLYRDRPLDGEVDIAFTRTDHLPVSGYGKIADISIVITDDLAKREWENWVDPDLTFAYAHDAQGVEIALEKGENLLLTPLTPPAYGNAFVYPVPARRTLIVNPQGKQLRAVRLTDLRGRALYQLADTEGRIQEIEVSGYAPGVYLLSYELEGVYQAVKVLVQP